MEQESLKKIETELIALREAVESISDSLLDDEAGLEVSDEVVREVEEARKGQEISHEDVVKEFLG